MTNFSVKLLITVILISFEGICTDVNRKLQQITYKAEFSEDLKSCKDFKNKLIKFDSLKIGVVGGNEDEFDSIGLSGDLEMGQSLEEGYSINIDVWKIMDVGKEFFFATVGDICENLKKEDALWYPLVFKMNITDCPIQAKIYSISNLLISLEFAKDILTLEMCGEYEVFFSVFDEKEEQLACYVLGISITEVEIYDV